MKICPQCEQTFNDDKLMFCLIDGSPLVPTESQPTVVIDRAGTTEQLPQRSNKTLWIAFIVVAMLFGIVLVVAVLMFVTSRGNETANSNQSTANNAKSNRSPTPRSSPSVSASPSASSTPESAATPTKPETTDEIVPIQWNTSAVSFKHDVGMSYKFECPASGTAGTVWGSDVYTSDSSICTAAVHAGVITLEDGGIITVEFKPGRQIYGATTRNGITSNPYGEYPISFVVK